MRQGTRNLSVEPVSVCVASGQLHSVKFVMFNFSLMHIDVALKASNNARVRSCKCQIETSMPRR